jgi:hypothetical protein
LDAYSTRIAFGIPSLALKDYVAKYLFVIQGQKYFIPKVEVIWKLSLGHQVCHHPEKKDSRPIMP